MVPAFGVIGTRWQCAHLFSMDYGFCVCGSRCGELLSFEDLLFQITASAMFTTMFIV